MKRYKFNKKFNYYLSVLFVLININAFSQQDPSISLYQQNMGIVNPAYAGSNDQMELNLNFRAQWSGIKQAPQTQALNFSSPINDRVGLGFSVVNDNVFVLNETDIYADFSYKLPLNEDANLFLGLKAGGSMLTIDLISLGINDPLFSENVSKFNPNFGMGAYLKGEKYYINLAVPALLGNARYENKSVVTKASDKAHFYFGGGYIFDLSESVSLTPSVLTRIVLGAPVSVDITGMVSIQDKTDIGISYHLNESIRFISLFKYIDWFQFGYAYEYTTSPIGNYNNGSHELLLRIIFPSKK